MRLARLAAMMLLCAAGLPRLMAPQTAPPDRATPRPLGLTVADLVYPKPPTMADCEHTQKEPCYSPLQLQTAYDMKPLYDAGLRGRGTTIAVVVSFGSPTIARDLAAFDRGFGLTSPPSFKVITPAGRVPPYNPHGTDRVGWAVETSLDVEYAHAMAPAARILLVETPVDETIGVAGLPAIVRAEKYVIDHRMANVITQSFGAAERTFPNPRSIRRLRGAFVSARAHHVTELAATGDTGPTSFSDIDGTRFFIRPAAIWPATDPLVTAVGGTSIHLDAAGERVSHDTAWNDCPAGGCLSAGGGGLSMVFPRPPFQYSVRSVTGRSRGIPDISLSADRSGGALVYTSFPGFSAGYHSVGGTSEASPLFAGIVAVADQANGHPLGFLNPRLYRLGSGSPGIPDITLGSTTVSFNQNHRTIRVKGWQARPGYDLATGLGTVDGAKLVKALTGVSLKSIASSRHELRTRNP